jgi:DNA-binding transcriptional LysR family regulator
MGRMHVESLKVYCDVVACRSFSQAAQANKLTQSAASQIVLQMETRLGVQLINRSTRPLQPTPLGQAFYEGCKGLVERYLEVEASIRKARDQIASTVRVAAIYSVGLGDLGQYVERFAAQQPSVKVHIEYLHPDRVCEKVLEGTADLGLLSFPRKSRELVALPWRDEDMVLTCASGHPLARHRAVAPAQLAGAKYIGFDKNLAIRREVDRFLRDQGVVVDVVLEFDNIENIKKAVELAAGVALLPEPTVRKEVQAGTLTARPLVGCRLVRPLAIIHRRQPKPTATVLRFVDLLRQPDETNGAPAANGEPSGGFHRPPRTNGTHRRRTSAAPGSKRTT